MNVADGFLHGRHHPDAAHYGLALSLGGTEVPLIEMTSLYVLANGAPSVGRPTTRTQARASVPRPVSILR
jgi:membrane carboxypeptidase/penicillin-binding protein PbpC